MPDSFAAASDGVVLIANGIDPVLRWAGDTQLAEAAGVVPPAVAPTIGSSGTGTLSGKYAAFVRFVDRYGNVSNVSPVSAQITVTNAAQITYADVAVPQSPAVVRKQILRNLDGNFTAFYVDVDTTQIDTTSFTSTVSDNVLGNLEPIPLFDTTGFPLANRFGVPPNTHPFLAAHIGRMWMAGYQEFSEGSVQVTRLSVTVAGIATRWPATFVGRFLYIQGQPGYEISAVNVDTQTLTLLTAYLGPTDLFAQYVIQPAPGELDLLVYSEAGLAQAFPPQNALSLAADGDRVTGLAEFGSFLYIFKRRKVYRMTAQSDPGKDAFIFYALGRGCVNNRCWVIVEEKLFLLDESGVYSTGGGDSVEQLSTPIQNLFRPGDDAAINWGASRWFHASFDQSGETIRWFVATSSSYLPKTALCLHYPSGKWTTEQYPFPIGAALTARTSRPSDGWGAGSALVFLGGPAGAAYALQGLLDGPPVGGPTTRGYATAAGIDSLTDARASFDTTASINAPCAIVAGRGAGQIRRIVAATTTVLKVDEPWAILPDTTTIYQIGGIPYRMLSGRMRFAPTEQQGGRSIEVQYQPTVNPLTMNLSLRLDFSTKPRLMGRDIGPGQRNEATAVKGGASYAIDLSKEDGAYFQRFDGNRELSVNGARLFSMQLDGVSGPEQVVIGEVVINGAVR